MHDMFNPFLLPFRHHDFLLTMPQYNLEAISNLKPNITSIIHFGNSFKNAIKMVFVTFGQP